MSSKHSKSAQLEIGWHNQPQTSQASTLLKTSQHTSDFLESLPPNLASRVRQLLDIQSDHSKLMQQYQREALLLEEKYLSLCTPLYTERRGIIDTTASPSAAADSSLALSTWTAADNDGDHPTGIPAFWLTAIRKNSTTADMITPEDEAALTLLKDVRLEYLDRPGFRLVFDFAANDWFENETLSKTFFYTRNEEDYTGGLVNGSSVGEDIRWKEGKDLTTTVIKTKRKRGKVHEEVVPKESFFDFFTSLTEPDSGNSEEGETGAKAGTEDHEEAEEEDEDDDDPESVFQWLLELDFGYGEALKDDIIPYAVHWYTGEATLFEEEEEDDSDDESEKEEDDSDDESEDEEESEDEDGD